MVDLDRLFRNITSAQECALEEICLNVSPKGISYIRKSNLAENAGVEFKDVNTIMKYLDMLAIIDIEKLSRGCSVKIVDKEAFNGLMQHFGIK